jgi:sugar lactone lactonase YvrE
MAMAPRLLVDGLHFPECPRWRDGRLWSLSNGGTWAELSGVVPDGICLDAEGAVWVANAIATDVVRVLSDGTITQRVAVSNHAFACMLGGPDRRTLFVLTADNSKAEYCRLNTGGRIEMFTVDVPGAGLP